jgi:hypothetical protein
MKDFDYYRDVEAEYHDYFNIKNKMQAELNNTPLTVEERKKREAELGTLARAKAKELNATYHEERNKKTAEFWRDCREDLGYESYLYEEGVRILESKADEDGHSGGYSEVYSKLQELDGFIHEIRRHFK